MPFEIIRNDISAVTADAVLCPAAAEASVGHGVDAALYRQAGSGLFDARVSLGHIAPGDARECASPGLKAKYVIFAVAPFFNEADSEKLLRRCLDRALALAFKLGCKSFALPLLGAGERGWPVEKALKTAVDAIKAFLDKHDTDISLVLFSDQAAELSQALYGPIKSYIDRRYVAEEKSRQAMASRFFSNDAAVCRERLFRRKAERKPAPSGSVCPPDTEDCAVYSAPAPPPMAKPAALSSPDVQELNDMLRAMDEGFSQKLLRMIDMRGYTDPQVYKRANIDRKLFSKIRNKPDYRPGKATVYAFAVALELGLAETRELLESAGFAMSRSSKFDIIMEYYIVKGCYDIFEINQALFAFDQPLLGS